MSWDGIVTEGAPASLGWVCRTTAFQTPVLCAESFPCLSCFEPCNEQQASLTITFVWLAYLSAVFSLKQRFQMSFKRSLNHVGIGKVLFSLLLLCCSLLWTKGIHHVYNSKNLLLVLIIFLTVE